jgi:hypothetical protein
MINHRVDAGDEEESREGRDSESANHGAPERRDANNWVPAATYFVAARRTDAARRRALTRVGFGPIGK